MVNTIFNPAPSISPLAGVDGNNKDRIVQVGALQVGDLMCFTPDNCASDLFDLDDDVVDVSTMEINRVGPYFYIRIAFVDLIMEVTDGAASGSHGSMRIGEFVGDDVVIQTARFFIEALEENDAAAFTGDTTDTTAVITNVSSLVDLQVGATITGVGIGVGARILSIDSATQITLDVVSTATGATVALTQPAISGGDTAFEIGLGDESIDAAADGDIGDLGDDTAKYALMVVADVGAFTEDSDNNPVARFTDDSGLYINWSGSAATVDASGAITLSGEIKLLGVLLALD
jgi:hypothetical protein